MSAILTKIAGFLVANGKARSKKPPQPSGHGGTMKPHEMVFLLCLAFSGESLDQINDAATHLRVRNLYESAVELQAFG